MSISIDTIKESLRKKGFVETEGGKHNKWFFYHNGKRTSAHIVFSRTPKMKNFDDSLLNFAKSELKLKTNGDVKDLWNCPMSREQYVEKLISYGVIDGE